MFVAGFTFITSEKDLEYKFGKYGRVKEVRIVRNPATGESRGFGFVGMSEEHEVDAAIEDLDQREWNGRRLDCQRARNVK